MPHGVIVLDDLHRVQSPAVHAFLDELIERLPAQWTVVISTRVAPRLALARWRAAGELAEFTQDDLRFSADEARALVQADQAGELAARLPELVERTQGWPAGLRLCLAALRGRAPGAALQGGRHAAVDRSLFDYLASEVLDEMPIALHDFLVRSSVLPVLTAAAAAGVTGDARAAQRLDEIERRGLFVTALDADERTLVLHDLFRDALEDRLHRRFPDELPLLLRRAAAVERDAQRRVGLLLRAGDWAGAEAALAECADDLLLKGLSADVRRLIAQFPASWRDASSRLLRCDAIAACMRWHWSEMATLMEAAVAAARRAGDADELRLSQALLLAAWNANDQVEPAQALLAELSGQPMPPEAELLMLDAECTLLHDRGDFAALCERFEQVLQRLEAHGSLLNWWECSPPTSWAGLPGMAPLLERYGREALRRIGERELPMRATLHALQAASLLWAGRIDEAVACTREAESDARWLSRAAEIAVALNIVRTFLDALRGDGDVGAAPPGRDCSTTRPSTPRRAGCASGADMCRASPCACSTCWAPTPPRCATGRPGTRRTKVPAPGRWRRARWPPRDAGPRPPTPSRRCCRRPRGWTCSARASSCNCARRTRCCAPAARARPARRWRRRCSA